MDVEQSFFTPFAISRGPRHAATSTLSSARLRSKRHLKRRSAYGLTGGMRQRFPARVASSGHQHVEGATGRKLDADVSKRNFNRVGATLYAPKTFAEVEQRSVGVLEAQRAGPIRRFAILCMCLERYRYRPAEQGRLRQRRQIGRSTSRERAESSVVGF